MAKIHRFIDDFDLSQKELEITGEIARQIIKVLKLEVGEKIELSDGKGIYAMAEIVKIGKNNVQVKIDTLLRSTSFAGQNRTILYCSVLKRQNFELVVQKTTECGISKIVPIISARTIKTGLNIERLKKIAKEASEQSGRSFVPEITEPISFDESLKLINENENNIIFDSSGELTFEKHCAGCRAEHSKFSAENYVRFSKDDSPLINIFIGPEGGWTEEELKKTLGHSTTGEAKNLNFKIASLGKLTLRAETAAIIASYLISNLQ